MVEQKAVLEKLHNYCEIVSMICPNCENLCSLEQTEGYITLTTTPKKYKIDTTDDWERLTSEYETWMVKHKKDVIDALPQLAETWPEMIEIIKDGILPIKRNKIHSKECKRVLNDPTSTVLETIVECSSTKCGVRGLHRHIFSEVETRHDGCGH